MNNSSCYKSFPLDTANPSNYKFSAAFINNKGIWCNLFCTVNNQKISVKNTHPAVPVRIYRHKHRCRRMLYKKRVEIKSVIFIPLRRAWKSGNHKVVNKAPCSCVR